VRAPALTEREGASGKLSTRVALMGLELDCVTSEQAIDYIMSELSVGRAGWVLTPNLHILRTFTRDPAYARIARSAALSVADGMPLIWASRLRGTPLPERIAGSELIWSLTARAAREGRSVFFLGGNPGSADAAAATLADRNPGLRVAGTSCPPMGFRDNPSYLASLEERLISAAPDICYVGLPTGATEPLIERLTALVPGTWFLAVGVSFSFVSGEVRKAPVWVRRIGLEWFYRLLQEPRRLCRRYLLEGIPFAMRLLAWAVIDRFRRGG
jgi:N-acetylglucosaminyldiphosphoundecaprenol N-acetyl-beta-D-mannosaminyltransferase